MVALAAVLGLSAFTARASEAGKSPEWTSANRFRVLLSVDPRGRKRSYSPASVDLDFQSLLGKDQAFDVHTVEVIAYDDAGRPVAHDTSRKDLERYLVPHRVDQLFGATTATLHFVMRDATTVRFAVYFDTKESRHGKPGRYPGLVGDGDRFRQRRDRREINACHFDQFVDFDGDGDLDLFKGGVEPFVYCYENVGRNEFVDRGRLASGGKLFTLPCSDAKRSWLTVAFYDIDGDGDQDFFPSFGDGPDSGQIVFYRNTTTKSDARLTFTRVGPLMTASGTPLAGGAQAGGWFPSITFVRDWDGEPHGRIDALVGSNHRCWLYRGAAAAAGADANANAPPRFDDPIALRAGDKEIELVNPRFDCADVDNDGDLDLFAATQSGPIWQFENRGTRDKPALSAGRVVAFDGKYLIGDAHSGVKIADFDGDGLLDLFGGRFWERADLNQPDAARDFGGFFRNVGSRDAPRFARSAAGAPYTEQFQICDAVRQNGVRAVDWDRDGVVDLLAGDTDGFVWFFRNESSQRSPLFAAGERIRCDGQPLSVAASGGHARFDVCDWNNDGELDLLVADGQGTLTLFRNRGPKASGGLERGEKVLADGKPIQGAGRASVLVCDWNQDGRKDVLFADERGFRLYRNVGDDANTRLAAAEALTFGGRERPYVRPNLGSFVDWDGDGQRDFIGCEFENSIHWYRSRGADANGPKLAFDDRDGVVILKSSSPQMISGAENIDWNVDGDLDVLTGQGHGGSGLRFYERDWLEDERRKSHPTVNVSTFERGPQSESTKPTAKPM